MAEQLVVLPPSVEDLIERICKEQSLPPLDFKVRQQLVSIGEEQAIEILSTISKSKTIRSLGGYIMFMLQKSPLKPSPLKPSPSKPSPFPPLLVAETAATAHSTTSDVLSALGELEFRKAFLLLSYAGSYREIIDSVFPVDYIRRLKDSPMREFESKIWEDVGKYHMDKSDRQLYLDWDSGRTHIYQCYISPDGSLRFKGPILQHTRTLLQKSLGDDNVLVVKFAEDKNVRNTKNSAQEAAELYGKFRKEGIRVGLRLYRFFVFKDGGKEEKKKDSTTSSVKCYFVRMESHSSADERALYILSNYKTIAEARSLFMHAHMLPSVDKYMARFSLILSKTLKLNIDFATVNVQTIEDVSCKDQNGIIVYHNGKPRILTDGTGFISEDLAVLCPNDVFKGSNLKNGYIMELSNLVEPDDMSKALGVTAPSTNQPPLLIQCRLFHMGRAIKGTLLVNKTLPPRTIQVRPSMIKVETDSKLSNRQSINSMEVVTTSNKPNRAYLSKYLIALLSYGGVPNDFFMDVLKSNLVDANYVYSNKRIALKACVNHGEMDEYNAAEMILCGIPLDEPFLRHHLSILAKAEKKRLRGGRLYLPNCFYLMGTVDPTGSLKMNEVCIIHENGQISGDVLVYRNPGLHFGDIHILQATPVRGLESYVGHSKYAIFFPRVGPRSIADEIAGGDFDGDMYWVSNNPQLLQYFRKSDPWIERSAPILDSIVKKPSDLSAEELEEHLFNLFLKTRFESSYAMGVAADSWMALMDRYLILRNDPNKENEMLHVRENILKLIDIYYEALDAPKKGGGKVQVPNDLTAELFPHYMDKFKSFTSTSILGKIYDEVSKWQTNDDMSGKEIGKLSCFDVNQVPMSCMEKWKPLYEKYRKDMFNALQDKLKASDEAAEVINFYKQILYDAANMEESTKNICDIFNEALAIYNVTYDFAIQEKSVNKCSFAWRVAGSALSRLYSIKQSQRALTCNPSVMREIFGS